MTVSKEEKKKTTEVKAFARRVHISPYKVRLLTRLIQKLPVEEALVQLNHLTKKAALPLKKLINSAVANARHNFEIGEGELYIKSLSVDGGPVFFRYVPRAYGRAFPIRKRTSCINLILGVRKASAKTKKPRLDLPPSQRVVEKVSESEKKQVFEKAKPREEKKPWFKFWQKKKAMDKTQVPKKQDAKGRHYTGFDRRGNM